MAKKHTGPSPEEQLASQLVGLMEAGTNPWQRPWTGTAGEHRNLTTGHHYQGANPLLLEIDNLAKGHTLPLWVGYAQAKANGWHPAKGSKAARIAQPRPVTIEDESAQPGEISTKARSFTVYKLVPVFNAADLAAVDDDSQAKLTAKIDQALGLIEDRPEAERLDHAERVLEAWPVPTTFGGAQACYSPTLDRIAMPEARAFSTREHYCATWAHEQVHSTGHSSRLNRPIANVRGSTGYAREELIAELGAALVCQRLSIGSEIEHHASYLSSWIEVLREEPKALLSLLGKAVKAANLITGEPCYAIPEEAQP